MILAIVTICTVSCVYCIFRPFHRNNVYHTARFIALMTKILGITVELRGLESLNNLGPVVYVANHQNNYDLLTMSHAVRPGTVSVGKKSLKWIPFFGQMYWLTGNILIDRDNTNKAIGTIGMTADKIINNKLSIWLFPEGTRSKGRGLLPLKTGAFRTAAHANVPVIPTCGSNQHGTIKLNRWRNGKIIIEFLAPVYIENDSREAIRKTANEVHKLMKDKIELLTTEAAVQQK